MFIWNVITPYERKKNMKHSKMLSLLLAASLASTSMIPMGACAAVKGDFDGDGVISSSDLTLLQNHILTKNTLTSEQAKLADINGDGIVDVFDVAALRKLILNTDRTLSFKAVTERLNDGIKDALKKLDLQAGGTAVKSTAELKSALSPYFSDTVVNNYICNIPVYINVNQFKTNIDFKGKTIWDSTSEKTMITIPHLSELSLREPNLRSLMQMVRKTVISATLHITAYPVM